ncbi:catalase-like domain-containing protein [Dactylonectria macrodidyma]|uniref:Catalase-like domain-containing protein n=1 Tax=Dactylonectria macrodidyma TaxID=307937 RepID=A0A9P9FQ34_9HYPO|nr:catalase-like domain-containing protein [Dactylonectria macrodidyma]
MPSNENSGYPTTLRYNEKPVYTTSNGAPIGNAEGWQRTGQMGPLLLQDFHLIDMLSHFDRERIPERVVHAKGAGAYSEFELTHDISDLASASMLNRVGKKTKAVVRFSTVGGEKGSPDSARDPRGFAIKFYTDEGNWDWVYNNTPVFFLRDPTKFPLFIHTQKRNPQTNLKDATMFWDYLSTHQEAVHQWTKPNGSFVFTQVHLKTDQGKKTFTNAEAAKMASENPHFATQHLFEAIERGESPSWTVYVQVLTPEQAEKFPWNIFDLTKVWPQMDVPLRPLGKLTLNQNVQNYFSEIEQVAFSPSHLVPGIEPTVDPVLQARLFSYPDTRRHRLGVNYQQIPVNSPLYAFNPFQRDGAMSTHGNYGKHDNYPSSYRPNTYKPVLPAITKEHWAGAAVHTLFQDVNDDDYVQAKSLWDELDRTAGQQENFIGNVSDHLSGAQSDTRERTYGMFSRVDSALGAAIKEQTEKLAK